MTQRVLVIEDSRTQAERLRLLLTREGYEVEVAATGVDGLAKAQRKHPQLVISDITMPEMDGYEFCRAMKSSNLTARVPIILLTARSSPADIIKGLECGADNFIPKPYDDAYLLDRVRRIFEQLEYRDRGHLGMEVILTVGERVITVTADRQQIMELLFSTFEDVSRSHDELAIANRGLRAARAEADRANHAKSQFLSRMSHELRTPLNAVMGFGQLLEMATLGSDDQESVRMIMAAGRHLLDLVDEVLDIGRIDAGELTLRLESVRAGDVIQEAIDLVRPLAASRSIRLRSDVDGSAVAVIADHQRLKQVILNLMSNAVKYNRWGGTVTVACRQGDNGRICIEVVDTGPGIAPQDLDRLFAPFDRLGAEQDTSVQGTGLGLALSKRLVEAMGGILSVESESGSGSTFAVELPLGEQPPEVAEVTQTPSGPLASAKPTDRLATVLYIEDHRASLALATRILAHRPNITLMTATTGRSGLDLARQHRPDLILLDLDLPDLTGEEVLRQLRVEPTTQSIPIVVLTADASKAPRDQTPNTHSIEAPTHLTKPLDVQVFLRVVDEILGLTRRER